MSGGTLPCFLSGASPFVPSSSVLSENSRRGLLLLESSFSFVAVVLLASGDGVTAAGASGGLCRAISEDCIDDGKTRRLLCPNMVMILDAHGVNLVELFWNLSLEESYSLHMRKRNCP